MVTNVENYRPATPEELAINPDITNIVDTTEQIVVDPIVEEKRKYDQRVIDGQNAFLSLMAELRLYSIANSLPRAVNRYIEDKLELVKSQVIEGQWVSAHEKLDAVIVEGFLSQELYDRIKNTLEAYILTSYGKSYAEIIA